MDHGPVRTIFMGSEQFSLPSLRSLLGRDERLSRMVRVVGVVTQPDRPSGRGRVRRPNPVKQLASVHDIPVLQPERLRDPESQAALAALRPDLIVVASFGQLLPRAVLDMPSHAPVNLHPSLLPLYRGSSPIAGPILDGQTETGTTLMLVRPKMDAGPILAQWTTPIAPRETAGELEARLAELSADLLVDRLPAYLAGAIQPVDQDEDAATYTSRLTKADGNVDWQLPAHVIDRRVRALNPWPGTYTFWAHRQIKILVAHAQAGEATPGQVFLGEDRTMNIGTGDGLLVVDVLQLPSGRPLPASHVLQGYRELACARLSGLPQ